VEHFVKALSTEDASVTAHDVEQWANLTTRLAIGRWREAPEDAQVRAESTAAIERSIEVLRALLGPPKGTDGSRWTVERLSILGGAHKRLAWIDPERRADALNEMADAYRNAAVLAAERECDTAYPLIQAAWAELAREWTGATPGSGDLSRHIGAARAELDAREADHRQFWYDSMRVDCDLLEAIVSNTLDEAKVQTIADAYLRHREHASAREFASVRDQVQFLKDMAALAAVDAESGTQPARGSKGRKRKTRATEPAHSGIAAQLDSLLQKLAVDRTAA
jgi:hypothetical protein